MKNQNPFYFNYVFKKEDCLRIPPRIRWIDKLWFWLFSTKVQINDGYVFFFKVVGSKYYLLKIEKGKEK